jgi:DNA-directed RNA polymerase subunit M/transcription elongation factor TFIIS
MQSCDVCAQSTTWAQGTSYTADDFRELVARGFEPVEQMASYLAQAKALHGLDEQKALFAWKNGLVAQSTTHWLLCPGCASLAARHLPRPAGGKPPERISEPLTDKMFVAPPPAQVAVTDYHSRGQSDAPSASRRPPADLPARTDSEKSTSRADVAPQAKTSDTFSFPCPSCGKRLKANRTLIGRRAKCRTCGSAVDIPDPLHAANGANDATQPPTGQTTTAEATTAEVRTAHSTTTPATTNPVPTDAPQSTTSPADGSEVPCCSCGDAIPESARRADVVGDMLGLLGSLTGGGLGNANQSRKTMPDLLFGGAMKCASCGRWMCCSCAERKAKAQGASHAALIASQARGTITHEGCGGIFERP